MIVACSTAILFFIFGVPTELSIFSGEKSIGSATVSQKLLSDGGKQVIILMYLDRPMQRVRTRIRQEATYDRLGAPVQKIQETALEDGSVRKASVIRFTKEGAELIASSESETGRVYPLNPSLNRADPSHFWFVKGAPKPGEKAAFYDFEPASKEWVLKEVTFKGKNRVVIGGRSIEGYEVIYKRAGTESRSIFDAGGEPLVLEMGNLRMERN